MVKIGSGVLTADHGLHIEALERIVSDIATLRERSMECIIVSSGAIAAGLPRMGFYRSSGGHFHPPGGGVCGTDFLDAGV